MANWAMGNFMGSKSAPSSFSRSKSQLGSDVTNQLLAAGWKNSWGDTWTSSSHPGQYLTSADAASRIGKQQVATGMSNPNNYNPGIDYMAMLAPYLGSGANSSSTSIDNGGTMMPENQFKTQLTALSANPDSIAETNAYKFRLAQGQQALERSAAAKGMLGSGNTMAALLDYGQGLASTEYGNEFNRLAGAMGQENQFNLGRANLNTQNRNSLAGIVLGAGQAQSGDYWNAQNLASNNALKTGYINQGIW